MATQFPAPIQFTISNMQGANQIRLEQSSATTMNALIKGWNEKLYNCSASKDGSSFKAKVDFFWMEHDVAMMIDKDANTGTLIITGFNTFSGTFDAAGEGGAVDAFIVGCGFPMLSE